MNKDIKRFFIDKDMVEKVEDVEKHECDCNGECGGDCKCHKEEEIKIDINDIIAKGELGFEAPADWTPSEPNDFHLEPLDLINETVNIEAEIKYLEGAKELAKISQGDLIDLYAYEDVFVPYMGQTLISLGFSLKLPKGYMAKLYPRSSTFKTWGLIQTNHTGIIDNSYCGNNDIYMYPVQCTMAKQTEKVMINGHKVTISGTWVKKGDKICQMEICEVPPTIEFNKVNDLQTEDRGGFGTTSSR